MSTELPGTLVDVQIDASNSVLLSDLFGTLEMPVNLRIESLENETGAPVFRIRDFKYGTGTRESGSFAFAYARNILNETDQHLVIDFSGAGIVSSSFADEFIAKLFCSLTEFQFNGRVRLHGLNSTNGIIIRCAISERRAKA